MVGIRSAIYFSFMVVTGSVWGLLSALARVLPVRPRFTFISQWAILNVAMLKVICGLGYRVEGRENVPKEPCVILSKHQSTWETMIMQLLFPPVTWVL
ncbi:MAG: 1-acyl-sn-glycerol-3-phosphate acyltransferase, partial [Gammaproteobacteria bacterium]|nr:1-acyl-sn-glycerol-3-phosphate acyltransferase [Gammaproteobacteria bacterium]